MLAPLINTPVDLSRPRLRERLRSQAAEMRRKQAAIEAAQREADRLLPEVLDLYIDGSDADRAEIRALLHECRNFRWGFGWGLMDRMATEDNARKALAVLSMKDGGSDYRDQIVALDHICAVMRRAGMPVVALFTEAAAWSSDLARFPPAHSTRALLLDRAQRFAP